MIALNTTVIIPAFNEEQAIGQVVNSIPRDLVREIIVVDIGKSKISGTLSGTIRAAAKISWMILRLTFETHAKGAR